MREIETGFESFGKRDLRSWEPIRKPSRLNRRIFKRDMTRISRRNGGKGVASHRSQVGKNLAIRLPGEIVKAVGLSNGERLDIETHDGEIVIRRTVPHFTLEELFRGKSPEQWRAAYAGAFDWGA